MAVGIAAHGQPALEEAAFGVFARQHRRPRRPPAAATPQRPARQVVSLEPSSKASMNQCRRRPAGRGQRPPMRRARPRPRQRERSTSQSRCNSSHSSREQEGRPGEAVLDEDGAIRACSRPLADRWRHVNGVNSWSAMRTLSWRSVKRALGGGDAVRLRADRCASAVRSARASPLKQVSAIWWLLSP